jgi:pimeloyl-ACP methyl ester carboxylesterase
MRRGVIREPTTVTVGGGLAVGLYEYGDRTGRPVMVFHGVPACGAGFAFADEPARNRKLRLIAPDRPGVGLSAPLDGGWTVGSYPAIVTQLADALGVDRFAVWGWSGGGPYAVACAATNPERVTRAAVSASMGEIGVWAQDADFEKTDRQMLSMVRKHPRLARTMMALTARMARMSPKSAAKSFAKQLSESDRVVIDQLGTPAEAMALFTQAFLRGARGVIDDYRAIGQPWGVELGAMTAPIKIFQGDADPMVPARHSRELAKRVPEAELVIWPGEGHLAMVTHVSEVIDWLVA